MSENKLDDLESEQILINFLFMREDIRNVVLPYLKVELFREGNNKDIIKKCLDFLNSYKSFPKPKDLQEYFVGDDLKYFQSVVTLKTDEYTKEYLLKKIEKFFKNRLIFNSFSNGIENLKNGKEIDLEEIQKATSFYFDPTVGLDPFNDENTGYNLLQVEDEYVKTSMRSLNEFLSGGFLKSGLTLFIAKTSGGKSLFMCSLGADLAIMNQEILYVSLEMTEKRIMRRMLTNIFNVSTNVLLKMTNEKYIEFYKKFADRLRNKIIIKYYPAKSFNTNKLRGLLRELKDKKKFVPKIIFVDYLGLMIPNVTNKDGNTNDSLEKVSQELHGLAGQFGMAVISAMQFNRDGMKSSSAGLGNVANSIGTTFTADEVILIKQESELKASNKYRLEKEKSRDNATGNFISLNVDYDKMMIYEDNNIQQNVISASNGLEKDEKSSTLSLAAKVDLIGGL